MKVLMFGWEFPPHISGGLGTACDGLTKGFSTQKDIEILFVIPKAYGDESNSNVEFIGANNIPVTSKKVRTLNKRRKNIEILKVSSPIIPYTSPDEYFKLKEKTKTTETKFIHTNTLGYISFTGKYGSDLFQEIYNYSIIAELIARDYPFDIIHAHDWLTYPAGIAAKKISGKPLIIHVHATEFDRSGGQINSDVYNIERKGMEQADKIITVSNLTRQIVIEKYQQSPNKVVTVYNAVEPNPILETIKAHKGLNGRIVTFMGRITLQKGPEFFIEAAYKILQKMDNVHFVMAGDGDMMVKMLTLAATRHIMDRFHFTGFLKGDQVFKLLKMSDVYIMPSVSEPFGISPLEAMQSNVPVIISKQSGVSELLKHAIKINYWDIDALADAIYGILNYPALSEMFKIRGKKEVDSFKWEYAAKKVRVIYNETLANA